MNRSKAKWLVVGVILLLGLMGTMSATGGQPPSGQPFQDIWDELDDHQQQIDDEAAAREAADAALQQAIDDEEAARIAADQALQNEIDNLEARLDNEGVLLGTIVMWSGTIDPNGNPVVSGSPDTNWHICDGSSGTPDLRDRFVVGAGGSYGIGDTGGADSVALTVAQMPRHNHYFSGRTSMNGYHRHRYNDRHVPIYNREDVSDGSHDAADDHWTTSSHYTSGGGAHYHYFSGPTTYQGGNQAHENRPPYYALAYIMKIA